MWMSRKRHAFPAHFGYTVFGGTLTSWRGRFNNDSLSRVETGRNQNVTRAEQMVRGRFLAMGAAVLIAISGATVMAQQGVIGGRAEAEADPPYPENYRVQLRDPATGAIIGTPTPLDTQARFSFTNLETNRRYLIELVFIKDNKVLCTEGPFSLSTTRPSLTDVDINCGNKHLILWLLAAGAGTAAVIAIATHSASK
jgi:hypothetical protein